MLQPLKKIKPSGWVLLVMTALLLAICSNVNWGKERWKNILEADGKGYYAYLPAVFIYQDLNYGFFDMIEREKYHDPNLFYDYRTQSNGKVTNKYFAGTALAQAPFFGMAHVLTWMSGGDADGYSRLYPMFINVAAVFYTLLGLLFLGAWLRRYGVKEGAQILVFIGLVFGTNLFYYIVSEPGMSHVYSFAFVSGFLALGDRYFRKPNGLSAMGVAAVLGMIVLIRPVNGLVVLLLPFLAGSLSQFLLGARYLLQRPAQLLPVILIGLFFPFIQGLIYYVSVDSFWVYSYGEEGFIWTDPHMWDILFSYKKGLFLYTPLYLLALVSGLWGLWKFNRFQAWNVLLFFAVLTYVLSSWWMWFYGGSFSSRVYIEYLPLFGFLLAMALHQFAGWRHKVLVGGVLTLLLLCQIQTYQYRYYQIHWADMTQEKYWDVFLRVDKLME
ncbi:hypothetical protein KFE98_01820 [bacterium SCSIO 12741]|nr:hypothetical protein KFE98_01820 [bacterium SCSIO 12741]